MATNPMVSPSQMLQQPTDAEKLRRKQSYAALGMLMGTQPTMNVGQMLSKDAQNERDLNAEIAAKAADIQRRAEERAETMDWRKQQQADLQGYREDSLAARQASQANASAARDSAQQAREEAAELRRQSQLRGETDKTRREYEGRRAKLSEATAAAQTVASLTADPRLASNPQAQMSLVFAFGKMLDPNSVVREGEYKLFESGRGILSTLGNFPERLATGARLTPDQVKNMRSIASTLLQEQQARERALSGRYHKLATERGYDPFEVVGDYSPDSTYPAPSGPASQPEAEFDFVNGKLVPRR